MELLNQLPCWYIIVGIIWSCYQGYRGIVETRHYNKDNWTSLWERMVVLYIHDFAFRFVCTIAGFFALYVSYILISNASDMYGLSSGTSWLLLFSFLIGVIGVGGQLHFVIIMGKLLKGKPTE